MLYVFGHKNPDSDSICSAIVAAQWLCHQGKTARAFRLGDLNAETRYILDKAGIAEPDLLTDSVADQAVWLVDFTDAEQGPESLLESDVIGIIDHHRLGTLVTRNPPDVWIRGLGSCATLLWQIITSESDMSLTPAQAILLLGAILSDTIALTSTTTTPQDQRAVEALFQKTGLNRGAFVDGLLAAKTDINGLTAEQLINKDAKLYQINGHAILLAQLEVKAMDKIDALIPGLIAAMDARRRQDKLDAVVLMATDITGKNSMLWFSDNSFPELQHPVSMPGVLSRKKEVLPWLTQQLTKGKR